MKRPSRGETNHGEPKAKEMRAGRENSPGGLPSVNPTHSANSPFKEAMEIPEEISVEVIKTLGMNAINKLEIIGRQMKQLKDHVKDVGEEIALSAELHNVACNFVKKPSHIYHLYQRPSGQKYFGMLSPQEWKTPPHRFLGSFRLEADLSWVPVTSRDSRNQGFNFLMQRTNISKVIK